MPGFCRVLLVACIACSGCVVIDSPIFRTVDDVVFDAELLGRWEITDGKKTATLQFERVKSTLQYRIVPESANVPDTADAYLVKLGDRTFLDVAITGQPSWGHAIFLVDSNDEGKPIALRPLDAKRLIQTDSSLSHIEIPLVVDVGDSGLPFSIPLRVGTAGNRITATTEELRNFLTHALTDVWFPSCPYEFKKLNPK